uniref:DUF3782 domain-containing protein n=1 Tax=Candidatus Kentrum sp. FW TaxID=2126338 RepID=A0A450SDU9_9GAMM|nr:MAG: hypothetical protein BECKFW1821A_GA0114235_102836 [Candidatus Kentron sp. FW]VFJ52821.1 MAG: hypothetical protein BECKFW1821B_GA0114236_101315 [Candidatus Kentron sp. FW]
MSAITYEEVLSLFKETAEQMKETDRIVRETAKQMRETDRKMKETDRRLKKAEDLFTSQWGRLVESLVDGALVPLFQDHPEYKMSVQRTIRRVKGSYEGHSYEFDILVVDGEELVIVEVKTTLRTDDVVKFLGKLDKCKLWMPEYASKKVYGAMAFLQANASADAMAENKKLFVIRATGDSAAIVNRKGFQARRW